MYKNEVTKRTTDGDPIEQEMVGKPRNVEQLRNLKKKINKCKCKKCKFGAKTNYGAKFVC